MEAADLGKLRCFVYQWFDLSCTCTYTCTCRDFPYMSVMTLVHVCCPNKDREISPVLYHSCQHTHIVLNMLCNYTCTLYDSISYVQFREDTHLDQLSGGGEGGESRGVPLSETPYSHYSRGRTPILHDR